MPAVVAAPDNAPVNVVADTLPALTLPVTAKLVSVPVLVIFGCAAVVNVPVKKLADTKLAPVILPPVPAPAIKLPTVALPVVFSVPATFTPVPVTTNMFALPAELIVTLALASTLTLLLPF